jgi:4-azaleucine resistance transporter AzlC
VSPLAIGVAVYGLAFGLLAAQAGMSELQVGAMGTLVFAGSSQIIAVERLTAGAGATAAIVAGLALNLRLILITASIRDLYRGLPWWRVALGAHFASDENWALLLARRAEGREAGYWYLVGAGAGLMVTWISASVAGVALAAAIPEPRALGMDCAFAAAFIAIMRSLWRGRADLLPWSVSACGVAALVMTETLAASWAIIIGGLAGAAIASIRAHD